MKGDFIHSLSLCGIFGEGQPKIIEMGVQWLHRPKHPEIVIVTGKVFRSNKLSI